jgi:hypothetical protein
MLGWWVRGRGSTVADLEVDGVVLADVSPMAWHLLRSGEVDGGQRRWVTQATAGRLVAHPGLTWQRIGRDPVSKQVLVWRPLPAVPAVRADRESRVFTCARCAAVIPDFLSFGVGGGGGPSERVYCLHHIPWWVRLRMRLRRVARRG